MTSWIVRLADRNTDEDSVHPLVPPEKWVHRGTVEAETAADAMALARGRFTTGRGQVLVVTSVRSWEIEWEERCRLNRRKYQAAMRREVGA